mgnify:CR=1 FL=1
MFRIICIIMILVVQFLGNTMSLAGSVQCTCPTVNAEGTGNSSCSASESGGKCTVDFNHFDQEDKQTAANVWNRVLNGRNFSPNLDIKSWRDLLELQRKEPDAFISNLMVYLLVAYVGGTQDIRDISRYEKVLRAVNSTLSERHKVDLLRRFSYETYYNFANMDLNNIPYYSLTEYSNAITVPVPARDVSVIIANGCIEVRSQNFWLMYKAWWSPTARFPQCAPPTSTVYRP